MKKSLMLVLVSVTVVASDSDNVEIQKRMADLHTNLKFLIEMSQARSRSNLKDPLYCPVVAKCNLAACCYLLGQEREAETLWQEVLTVYPQDYEAHANLKELYYRRAMKLGSPAGQQYARKALTPSKIFTLDQEKTKQLVDLLSSKTESEE